MDCGKIASTPPLTITTRETLETAIEKLARYDVGVLVVVEAEDPKKPVGILSERDVVRALAGKAPLTVTVDKVATTYPLITVYIDQPVKDAVEKMKEFNIRHVIVLERNGDLYGVISVRDILKIIVF